VGNKIYKTTEILDKIYHLKNRGVTYWAESTGLLIDNIIDFDRLELIKKTTCYSLSISRLAACIWIIFYLFERYDVGLCLLPFLMLLC
jgi:hypothetical protein